MSPQTQERPLVPRMQQPELEDLIAYIVRHPGVRAEAKRFLPSSLFTESSDERPLALMLTTLYELMDKEYPDGNVPYRAIYHALGGWFARRLRSGRGLDERDNRLRIAIFATPDDVETDEITQVGLLWRIYKDITESELDTRFGLSLLKRFLSERATFDQLRTLTRSPSGGTPENVTALLTEMLQANQRIEAIGGTPVRSIAEEWGEHKSRLERHRGRELIGLRTGIPTLDERTLGLRGFFVLGARPNVGKTALSTQIAVNVCQYHSDNDAVVVFVSLDMDRYELYRRVNCCLSRVDWRTLMFGSPVRRGLPQGSYFHDGHQRELDRADSLILTGEIGRRLTIVDRQTIGPQVTAAKLASLLFESKARVGATRALLVIDYLQLVEAPDEVAKRGDLEADKFRAKLIQDVIAATTTSTNPNGDAVLAISEMRKPSGPKEAWGDHLADVPGSARLVYAADAVLLYRRMTSEDVLKYCQLPVGAGEEEVRSYLERIERDRVSPVVLTLDKARDGMTKGEIPLEFDYGRSTFRVLTRDLTTSTLQERPRNSDTSRRSRRSTTATR